MADEQQQDLFYCICHYVNQHAGAMNRLLLGVSNSEGLSTDTGDGMRSSFFFFIYFFFILFYILFIYIIFLLHFYILIYIFFFFFFFFCDFVIIL